MAGKIHTDSEALYAVRHAITKFADDIQNSQGRFLTCFERMNTQVDNYLRSRECKIEEYSNKRREIEYQFEELNEQERIVRDYVEQNPDGRTDSFLCDICDTRMMLKVMGDTTHCKSSSGCDGTMHRVYNNSEYQKYRTAQAQIEEQKKKLHNLETELSEAIKVLQTEKDETEDLKHTFLMQQDTIIGLLDLNSGVDVDSTIAFIDKALITLGEYQAVTIETTKGELEKKKTR